MPCSIKVGLKLTLPYVRAMTIKIYHNLNSESAGTILVNSNESFQLFELWTDLFDGRIGKN